MSRSGDALDRLAQILYGRAPSPFEESAQIIEDAAGEIAKLRLRLRRAGQCSTCRCDLVCPLCAVADDDPPSLLDE